MSTQRKNNLAITCVLRHFTLERSLLHIPSHLHPFLLIFSPPRFPQLSSLLAGTRTVFSTDHPINVGGCSVASTSATIGRRVDFVKASPAWKRRGHEKSYRRRGPHSSRRDRGSSRVRSHVSHVGDKLPEPLPSFSGGKEKGCPSTSPPRRRQITRNVGPEDTQLSPTPEASTSASPSKKRCLPTVIPMYSDAAFRPLLLLPCRWHFLSLSLPCMLLWCLSCVGYGLERCWLPCRKGTETDHAFITGRKVLLVSLRTFAENRHHRLIFHRL